jgi:hypothetical protein
MNSEAKMHQRNLVEGIDEYLKLLGKLIVTPKGPFSSITEAAIATDNYKTTVIRRCNSLKPEYQNWFIIEGAFGKNIAEECKYCDQLDNMLFAEDCWLENVEDHLHTSPILGSSQINYLYKGDPFKVKLSEWVDGLRPHLVTESLSKILEKE